MDLKEYNKQKAELSKKLSKHGEKMLSVAFKEFFEAQKEIVALRWTQYTPSFNDGDVCEFSVHDFDLEFKEPVELIAYDGVKRMSDELGEDGFIDSYSFDEEAIKGSKDEKRLKGAFKALEKLESETGTAEDVFRATFGDGVRVTANAKGFDVDDYQHD